MRGKNWRIQYEGLHDLCFKCGNYVHRELACSSRKKNAAKERETDTGDKEA